MTGVKIISINGSPRKKFSCGPMLESFNSGIRSVAKDADVRVINLYEHDYKGCRSCLMCKKIGSPDYCMVKDEIHELLKEVRSADGIVFASPIYYFDVSGELRCFFERLMYPGPVNHTVPITAIYAMNANKEAMEQNFRRHLDDLEMFLKGCFHSDVEELFVFNSLQRLGDDSLYKPSRSDHAAKRERREKEFPKDLQTAYMAGVSMAEKIIN